MRILSKILVVAGLTVLTGGAALAQDVRIRVGEPGWREHRVVRDVGVRPVVERRVIERRRFVEPRRRTVCRTVIRERVRGNGVVVRRPTEVCRTVVGGRRVYVD